MEKNRFIESYVASFLGAVAAVRYCEGFFSSLEPRKQPVQDAQTLGEYAWDSIQQSAAPSISATTGGADTAATGKDSIPIT